MPQLTLYGIPNCDTMKKARKWLDDNGLEYTFHNYRKDSLDRDWLKARIDELGWEQVVNRRGTTWRQLPQEQRDTMDADSALETLLEQSGMIKRPLFGPLNSDGSGYLLGFKADDWQQALNL
ncbi:ArsC family reductase [Parendozoicomonas haliclonae]|uniref:Regulatory protein MgsR n=1 Tax=Parendozoicomonas haliclonae TaxID=1960125 RepID=A0A1X7ANQ4_9GAMM|nr:ArsC family reductase [Parendozoicomonas haliclonae]SMA49762.1 Regulatory protein MgsR [Parendozoicomonas haliclonae]